MSEIKRAYRRLSLQHPVTGQLLRFITQYILQKGFSPSYREMMVALDGKSMSVISHHLRYLERIGKINWPKNGRPRGITVCGQNSIHFTSDEWVKIDNAWGDDFKSEILKAAEQTRFVVTGT